MTEKVKVSREVAKAIEEIVISDAYTIFGVVEMVAHHTNKPFYNESQIKVLRDYFTDKGDGNAPTIDELIYALTVGFEVEQMPEEQVEEEYQYWLKALNNYEGKELGREDYGRKKFASGFVSAVAKLSQIHKIKGVNA